MAERIDYNRIRSKIEANKMLYVASRLGFCREWTRVVMLYVRSQYPDVKVEAREVDITENLQHTFPMLTIENDEPYICDGVGTAKHSPYFGYESDAPQHLQNSRPDMINRYL